MSAGIVVNVTRADRLRLEAIVADRSAPQKHVWRAKVILAPADGCGTAEIMRRSGKSKPVVWTWQARFMAPTSASWLNAVEGFFAKLTRRRLKRGVFRSVADLQAAINRFVEETNSDPKPFVWTADAKRVLAAVKRGKEKLESIH
jgi:hypothetical protein